MLVVYDVLCKKLDDLVIRRKRFLSTCTIQISLELTEPEALASRFPAAWLG